MRIVQSQRAERDVLDHYLHIGLQDPAAADRFLEAVDRTYARLAERPDIGSKRLWRHRACTASGHGP